MNQNYPSPERPVQTTEARLIAFYLPQFHPIPENNEWWGQGFTEWTNVARGRPLFPGHYQPHVPADLGFYDLRLPEARQAQADLAQEYGIHGFCYYHYWFNGKRLLDRPFQEVLDSRRPTMPFCLCWANENWTRRWDGNDEDLLIGQRYCEEDDRAHMRWLVRAFQDERYIRVAGKPLFLVYRANRIPRPVETTTIWREEAQRAGVGDIYLCRVESFADERGDPATIGFDAAIEFQPDWCNYDAPRRLGSHNVYEYPVVVERMVRKQNPAYSRFPCVMPSWDNSPRRKTGASVFRDATPALYEKWLTTAVQRARAGSADERLVFVNAWNEWGEGNHLEPCQQWGRGYLEATLRAINQGRVAATGLMEDAPGAESSKYSRMLRTVRSDVAEILRHAQAGLAVANSELEAANAELARLERLEQAVQEMTSIVPTGSAFILVDEEELGADVVADRRAIPFLERDGQYWGDPPDDDTAIRELERLRSDGAAFMVFAWPAFWWFDHYHDLARHVRSQFGCLLENDRLVVFDLRHRVESLAQDRRAHAAN